MHVIWSVVVMGLTMSLLSSCGEKKKKKKEPEVQIEDSEDEIFYYFAHETFDYANGRLEGNRPPSGFSGRWERSDEDGESIVDGGVLTVKGPLRLRCRLDTSQNGPFGAYLDDRNRIGKTGDTVYISFYQKLLSATSETLGLVQFFRGYDGGGVGTLWAVGLNKHPRPDGLFGLRIRFDQKLSVAAPEPLNSRENLIVLKIQFGAENKDRIYYYYNPTVKDERRYVGAKTAEDLSFNEYGFFCPEDTLMQIRNVRFGDSFESVAVDIFR